MINQFYFIRSKSNPNIYIHFIDEEYTAATGNVGACVFDKENANRLITSSQKFKHDLEMVSVVDVLVPL